MNLATSFSLKNRTIVIQKWRIESAQNLTYSQLKRQFLFLVNKIYSFGRQIQKLLHERSFIWSDLLVNLELWIIQVYLCFTDTKSLRVQKRANSDKGGVGSFTDTKSLRVQKLVLVVKIDKNGFTDTKSLRVQKLPILQHIHSHRFTDTKSLRVQKLWFCC